MLVSFVVGALTGVGMWFTTIQVSARTIGLMVDQFHWMWAIEWTFFCLEIVSGYPFYRYGTRLPDRARMTLLVIYSIAAWFSLFWINGILSWQLTPGPVARDAQRVGRLLQPELLAVAPVPHGHGMTIAALVACVVVERPDAAGARAEREELIHRGGPVPGPDGPDAAARRSGTSWRSPTTAGRGCSAAAWR